MGVEDEELQEMLENFRYDCECLKNHGYNIHISIEKIKNKRLGETYLYFSFNFDEVIKIQEFGIPISDEYNLDNAIGKMNCLDLILANICVNNTCIDSFIKLVNYYVYDVYKIFKR
jgi:hypothetical protein